MKTRIISPLSAGLFAAVALLTSPFASAQQAGSPKDMKDILPLPPVLYDADGKEVPTESLRGKIVALYFSASWCGPCKKFTPRLIEFRDANVDNGFEVVFMSLDRSASAKQKYMKQAGMKWLTAPGQSTREINYILDYHKQPGIPALVVFGPDGEVVTPDGRADVVNTPEQALAKWKESLGQS